MMTLVFEIERDPEPDLDELDLYEAALDLQNGLLAHATGGSIRNADYQKLRRRLMNDGRSKVLVPTFVRTCRDPRLWGYITARSRITPSVRTEIYEAFRPFGSRRRAQAPSSPAWALARSSRRACRCGARAVIRRFPETGCAPRP